MNIGQASKASGVSAKMIRYYESVDLIPPSARRESGYRDYGAADIHRLAFIRRARDLGFSMDQIRDLLRLWGSDHRSNAEVKAIALGHVADLKRRARELNEIAEALRHLATACEGDGRPDCPIIKGLEGKLPIELDCHVGQPCHRRIRATLSTRRGVASHRIDP
jgi:Cu(I)-responsive transcriptional regulator